MNWKNLPQRCHLCDSQMILANYSRKLICPISSGHLEISANEILPAPFGLIDKNKFFDIKECCWSPYKQSEVYFRLFSDKQGSVFLETRKPYSPGRISYSKLTLGFDIFQEYLEEINKSLLFI